VLSRSKSIAIGSIEQCTVTKSVGFALGVV
jgi:hypothetical protein